MIVIPVCPRATDTADDGTPRPAVGRNVPSPCSCASAQKSLKMSLLGGGRARFRRQPAPAAASRQHPAARRRAGSLKTVYVGERWHGGQHLFCNALRGNLG